MHQEAEQRSQQLDEEWRLDGKKWRELHSKVQLIAKTSKQNMMASLEPGSKLECPIGRRLIP